MTTTFARAEHGIPVVDNSAARDALYPAPGPNQRVQNLASGFFERWTGSIWAQETPILAAESIDAFPIVASTVARDARFPSPPANQRVQRTDTGHIERFDTSSGEWRPEGVTRAAGPIITAQSQGLVADGATDDAPFLQAADAAAVASGGRHELDILQATQTKVFINSNVTLSAHFRPTGKNKIYVNTGKTLIIAGAFDPAHHQVFDPTSPGTILIQGPTDGISPFWFGVLFDDPGDGSGTDNTAALQKTVDAMPNKSRFLVPAIGSYGRFTGSLRVWGKKELVFELVAHGGFYPDAHSGLYYAGPEGTEAVQFYNTFGTTWRGIKVLINNGTNSQQIGLDFDQFPSNTIIGGLVVPSSVTSENNVEECCVVSQNNSIYATGVRFAFTSGQNVERQVCTRVAVFFNQNFNNAALTTRGTAFQVGYARLNYALNTPVVTGAAGAGTINITGSGGSGSLPAGTKFQIAGDNNIYRITADSAVAAGGTTATAITPTLQTSPAGAAVTILRGGANAFNIELHKCDSTGAANFCNAFAGMVLIFNGESQWSNIDLASTGCDMYVCGLRPENGRQFFVGSGVITLITNAIRNGGWDAAFPIVKLNGTSKLTMYGNDYSDQGGAPVAVDADPASNCFYFGAGNHFPNGVAPTFANFANTAVEMGGTQGLSMYLGGGGAAGVSGPSMRFGNSTNRATAPFVNFGDFTLLPIFDAAPGCDDLLGADHTDGCDTGAGAFGMWIGGKLITFASDIFGKLKWRKVFGGFQAAVSLADQAWSYYDDAITKVMLSENAGGYRPIMPVFGNDSLAAATSKTINFPHTLRTAPAYVKIVWTQNPGAFWWITAISTTQFTVNTSAAVTATFTWVAQ